MSKRSRIFRHHGLTDCCDDYAKLLFVSLLVNLFIKPFRKYQTYKMLLELAEIHSSKTHLSLQSHVKRSPKALVGNDEGGIDLVNDTPYCLSTWINTIDLTWTVIIRKELDVGKIQVSAGTMYGEERNICSLVLRKRTDWTASLECSGIKRTGWCMFNSHWGLEKYTRLKAFIASIPFHRILLRLKSTPVSWKNTLGPRDLNQPVKSFEGNDVYVLMSVGKHPLICACSLDWSYLYKGRKTMVCMRTKILRTINFHHRAWQSMLMPTSPMFL